MKSIIFILFGNLCINLANAQTLNVFPKLNDSIPIGIRGNYPCEKGFEAFNNNQIEKALKNYNSALSLERYDPVALFNRGLCYYKIQDSGRSCADFKFSAFLGLQNSFNNYKSFCDSGCNSNSL